jgi:glycosyltransferase involved in cell wall biosynthesis
MKLIIQIPCLNEERTLPQTVRDIPRDVSGIDCVEILVIDDGSTDRTIKVAKELGVDHVLSLGSHRGLAGAFSKGIEYAVAHGADIVVNTDADNQYCGQDIARLVQPILEQRADMVVGCRPILAHSEFNPAKKILQLAGSATLRMLSRTTVRDAASGFRAFSRETCERLFVHSRFSYCMETLIQAGNTSIRVASVDIRVNKSTRPSRLFKSIPQYLWKSGSAMATMFILYRPGRFFGAMAGLLLGTACLIGLRFLYLVYWTTHSAPGRTYLPSLILLTLLAMTGVILIFLGVLGELIKTQRRLTEELLFLARRSGNKDVQIRDARCANDNPR